MLKNIGTADGMPQFPSNNMKTNRKAIDLNTVSPSAHKQQELLTGAKGKASYKPKKAKKGVNYKKKHRLTLDTNNLDMPTN